MNFIAEAQSMFNDLPSSIRDRFANDPGTFLDFCSNDVNRKELAQMGLLSPEATSEALSMPPPLPPIGTPISSLVPPPVPPSATE
jgi:phage internal scaffolding protein